MWLLVIFILVPLIEIGLFVQVGGWIGLWPTLLIVLLTAILGSALVRSQGLVALGKLQGSLQRLDNPAEPLAHGAMILFSGMLLLTPGFFTDAVGFALLVPRVREIAFQALKKRINVQSFQMGGAGANTHQSDPFRQGPNTIDGEFQELDPDEIPPRRNDRPSGWTQ